MVKLGLFLGLCELQLFALWRVEDAVATVCTMAAAPCASGVCSSKVVGMVVRAAASLLAWWCVLQRLFA
jgi:hypothetical protein